jgi:glutamine transport system substrate-binding protein
MKNRVLLIAAVVLALMLSATLLVGCSSGDDAVDTTPDEAFDWRDELVKGDGRTVLIGADTNWPPFEFAADDGIGFQGFDVDLMNAIGEKLGVNFEFKTYDFDGIIAGLATGEEFDMVVSALTIKPTRYEEVDFGLPYFEDTLALAAPNSSTISSFDDITDDTRVAVQSGSTALLWAENNLSEETVSRLVVNPDAGPLFLSMLSGDADALIQDMTSIVAWLEEEVRDAKLVDSIDGTGVYFGMAYQRSNKGEAMKADIDAALLKVVADGTFAEIYEKWFGIQPSFLPGTVTLEQALAAAEGL